MKKLLALAASSDSHEATSAKESAEALIKKHAISKREIVVVEQVIEVIEEQADAHHIFAAHLAAGVHGCRSMHRFKTVALKGATENVKRARGLYRQMLDYYAASLSTMAYHVAPWARSNCEVAWKFYWWSSFADAFRSRDPKLRRPKPSSKIIEEVEEEVPAEEVGYIEADSGQEMIDDVRSSERDIDGRIDVRWFASFARAHGGTAGTNIPLRLEEADFLLPAARTK